MKKKLIVSGCSFVDHNFYSMSSPEMDCSFPKWATIIADRLDMDLINLAFSGAGNNHILSTLTDCIADTPKEEIGLVLASWSQVQREDYEVYDPYSDPRVEAGLGAWNKDRIDRAKLISKRSNLDRGNKNFIWKNERLGRSGDIFYWVLDTLRKYILFERMCKSYNLPYKQFQMIDPFNGYINGLMKTDFEVFQNKDNPEFVDRYDYKSILGDYKQDRKKITELILKYEKHIDLNHFIGWPAEVTIGGFTIEQKCLMTPKSRFNRPDLVISQYDFHPNEKGHQIIADYIYGHLV